MNDQEKSSDKWWPQHVTKGLQKSEKLPCFKGLPTCLTCITRRFWISLVKIIDKLMMIIELKLTNKITDSNFSKLHDV